MHVAVTKVTDTNEKPECLSLVVSNHLWVDLRSETHQWAHKKTIPDRLPGMVFICHYTSNSIH